MALRLLTLAALAATALAKTDLEGCTYVDGVYSPPGRTDIAPYATRTWYVPDTGEICEFLDCGGGRAPPKTDVPGCGNYKGTDTYSPKFMPSSTTDAAGEEATDDAEASGSEALTTAAPTESGAAPEESGSGSEDGDDEGAESGDDAGSGATVMGASFGGVVAMAAVLGLF